MHKFYLKYLIIILMIVFYTCNGNESSDKSSDKTTTINITSSVFTGSDISSSRLENGDDYLIMTNGIYVTVEGVRGVVTQLLLSGEDNPRAWWLLFSNKEAFFDLASLQELLIVNTKDTQLQQAGALNTITMYITYLEIDLLFKGEKMTIHNYWSDDNESGAKKGDIMVKDTDGVFKWMRLTDRTLTSTRPEDNDTVIINSADIMQTDGEGDAIYPFTLDHFGNLSYIISPPPWNQNDSDPQRLESYFTVSEETLSKDVIITLDLSFVNAAFFSPYKKIHIDDGDDQYDLSQEIFFIFDESGDSLIDITDNDGNSISSTDFTLKDMLPGMIYPEVFIHVVVSEE